MPQRSKIMQHDGTNFIIATITGGWTFWLTAENLAILVPCLWAIYVLMLIAKTTPEVLEKHPWAMRILMRLWMIIRGLGRIFRRKKKAGEP